MAATVVVEGAIFAGGVCSTPPGRARGGAPGRSPSGRWSAFLVAMAVANQLSTPPGEAAVAWGTLSMWLIVGWMAWIDRLRQPSDLTAGAAPATSGPP